MKKVIILLVATILQACAFTDATLDVKHNADTSFKGPLSELDAKDFLLPMLEDKRNDTARIGWKKNGYGANTADIMTLTPVEEIVENAITSGLEANGHTVKEDGRIKIKGTVDRFWFEVDTNFWTVEFIGDVQCTVQFFDSFSDALIYESKYSGTYSEKTGGGLEKTWTKVMSIAVDKLVEDLVFDEDLVEVLEGLE